MDNSSGFRSQLMTKLREKLGIETKFSAPYHYASHGGVEPANQTIERRLRKFLSDYPKSWDKSRQAICDDVGVLTPHCAVSADNVFVSLMTV